AAIRFTEPDFKAVMKVQHAGRHVRNAPLFPRKQLDREFRRKFIISIFNHGAWLPRHRLASFLCRAPANRRFFGQNDKNPRQIFYASSTIILSPAGKRQSKSSKTPIYVKHTQRNIVSIVRYVK